MHLPSSSSNHVFRLPAQLPERVPVVTLSTTESQVFFQTLGCLPVSWCTIQGPSFQNLSFTLDIHPEIVFKFAVRMLGLPLSLVTLHGKFQLQVSEAFQTCCIKKPHHAVTKSGFSLNRQPRWEERSPRQRLNSSCRDLQGACAVKGKQHVRMPQPHN